MPSLKQTKVEPLTERPRIPGYGISKSKTGMLPWEWAVKTLTESREYWIVTVRPNGRPHAMIIWGLWFDGAFWFGTGSKTQKARNLAKNPNCVVGTQNAAEAVILEGIAELITDPAMGKRLEPASLSKYGMSSGDGSEPLYRVRRAAFIRPYRKDLPENCDALDIRLRSVSAIEIFCTSYAADHPAPADSCLMQCITRSSSITTLAPSSTKQFR